MPRTNHRLWVLANVCCVAAAVATVVGYGSIVVNSGASLWAYAAIFCVWGLVPYGAGAAINLLAARWTITALAALGGSAITAGIGLLAMHAIHRNTLIVLAHPQAMNCYGPLLEAGTPLVQLVVLAPVALIVLAVAVGRR